MISSEGEQWGRYNLPRSYGWWSMSGWWLTCAHLRKMMKWVSSSMVGGWHPQHMKWNMFETTNQMFVTWVSANSPFWPISLVVSVSIARLLRPSRDIMKGALGSMDSTDKCSSERCFDSPRHWKGLMMLSSFDRWKNGENGCGYGDNVGDICDIIYYRWFTSYFLGGCLKMATPPIPGVQYSFFSPLNSCGGRVCHFKHAQMSPWNLQKNYSNDQSGFVWK